MKIYKSFIFVLAMGLAPLLTSCDEAGNADNPVTPPTPSEATPSEDIKIESIKIVGENIVNGEITVEVGATIQLTADIYPVNPDKWNVSWSTSTQIVAKVSETGLVTAIRPGDAVITVKSVDNPKYSATVTVHVVGVDVIESITIHRRDDVPIEKKELTIYEGQNLTLGLHYEPIFTTELEFNWTCSNENALILTKSGDSDTEVYIYGLKKGDAVITCISKADPTVKDSVKVHVIPDPSSIEEIAIVGEDVIGNGVAMFVDGTTQLKAIAYPSENVVQVTWYATDSSVATVSDDGVVTGLKKGMTYIYATLEGSDIYAWVTVTVVDDSVEIDVEPVDPGQAEARPVE